MMQFNVFIYSCFPIVRISLELFVKNNISNANITTFNSIDELLETEFKNNFQLLLIDTIHESELNMIYNCENLIKKKEKIIFFTETDFLKNKKFTYLDKSSDEKKIMNCLYSILDYNSNYKEVTKTVKKNKKLSKREVECAILLMKGYTVNQISKKLSLALTTISTYKMRILKKTNTNNIVELTKSLYNLENI